MRRAGPQHYLFIMMVLAIGMLAIFWTLTTYALSTIEIIAVIGGFGGATFAVVVIFWLIFR